MAKRKTSAPIKRSSSASPRRKSSSGKWRSFFKYLVIVVISSVIAIFLFVNRQSISTQMEKTTDIVKQKVFKKKIKVKKPKRRATIGYDKNERASLDALISEKAE